MSQSRRQFIKGTATLAAAAISNNLLAMEFSKKTFYEISLAQWSLHKQFFARKADPLDFAVIAKKQFDISAVEYVNQFYKGKANDQQYLNELLKRSKDNGVYNHLIMIDGEGELGNLDEKARMKAVENHYKWVDVAKFLGCQSVRVNAYGKGTKEEVQQAAVDGLGRIGEYADKVGVNVIVENHGGYTSDGDWLLGTIKKVGRKNVGILPDLGNFCVKRDSGELYSGKCVEEYDKYKAVTNWMPYAKGVSAKAKDFDANGNCVETDYPRMLKIIKDSGFNGYVGIEYEGEKLSEEEGIKATKMLLEKATRTIG